MGQGKFYRGGLGWWSVTLISGNAALLDSREDNPPATGLLTATGNLSLSGDWPR